MGGRVSINNMNAIFKEAYKEFLETGKMPEPTPEQLEERKRREEMEKYIDSLPPLSAGTYKVKLLKDFAGGWHYLIGNTGDVVTIENCGVRSEGRSMGTRHRAGCINIDGGMSPSWLFVPGIDIEIIEKVKDE